MTSLIFIAGVGYAYYKHHRKQQEAIESGYYDLDEGLTLEGKETVHFLPTEHGIPKHSLSTVTFFEGDYEQVAPLIEARVANIRACNPWLGGFLAPPPLGTTKTDDLQLWYDSSKITEEAASSSFHCYQPGEIPMTTLTPFDRYNAICMHHDIKVPPTDDLIGKNIPLWQVKLIPDAAEPNEKFILVVSMATLLGDAFTFYALYNQLSLSKSVVRLNTLRKNESLEEAKECLGQDEFQYLNKIGKHESDSPLMSLWSSLSKDSDKEGEDPPKPEILVFRVRTKWMEEQRELHPTVAAEDCDDTARIVSWFFRLLQPEVGLLTNSLRDVLPSLDDLDAGNYQSPVPLTKQDYELPQYIQTSLQTGRRHSHGESALPDHPSSFGVAVDWARFSGAIQAPKDHTAVELDIDGLPATEHGSSVELEQTYHFPLMDTKDLEALPENMSGLIVFRGTSGQLGAVCIVPQDKKDLVRESGIMDVTGITFASLTRQGGSLKVGDMLRQTSSLEVVL